jgi:hypothetical protein
MGIVIGAGFQFAVAPSQKLEPVRNALDYDALADILGRLLHGQLGKEQLAEELRHIAGELHRDKFGTVGPKNPPHQPRS